MKAVPLSAIKRWEVFHGYKIPSGIGAVCSKCSERVLFALEAHNYDSIRKAMASTARCPGCNARASFWTISPKADRTDDLYYQGRIFTYPAPSDHREAMVLDDDVPKSLVNAYHSTVDAYNSKNFIATGVCCRRTLEGLFKFLLPREEKALPLARAMNKVVETVDLAKPLHNLSHAIRHGGNLSAHFDAEKEPDKEMAQSMVELLEYMLNFLYVLPKKIERLDRALDASHGGAGEN